MKTVGISACSDALKLSMKDLIQELVCFLEESGIQVLKSNCIFEKNGIFSGTGKEKAEELMKLFSNPEVEEIYDVSGGDMANQILDDLDFEQIKKSRATFWGYSDLTTIINAIYTMTGKSSVLFQMKNMVHEDFKEMQRERYLHQEELFNPSFRMIQGKSMQGIVVGGNIRCFLKLAGTKYFPDVTDKILLIEGWGGQVPQMITYLSQLKSCGVFDKVRGILIGTFTMMEEKGCHPDIITLVKQFAGENLPIAKTEEIGHYHNAKAIWIGKELSIQ